MHHITVQRVVPKTVVTPTATELKGWAKAALENQPANFEMTIRIVDTAEMTQLNSDYRHKPKPTNVLSFPFDMPTGLTNEPSYLGDIIICAPVVNQEADEQKKSVAAHWAHMVVHGTLHLLGYDHETLPDANIMEPLEINILKQLDFPNPYQGKNNGR